MKTPEAIKQEMHTMIAKFPMANYDNHGMKGAITGLLNKACGSNEGRKMLLKYLFGKASSKELTGSEWIALIYWIDLQNIGEDWLPQKDFYQEAKSIVNQKFYTFD